MFWCIFERCLYLCYSVVAIASPVGCSDITVDIVCDCSIREACQKMMKHIPNSFQRAEFLPVEWRSKLTLDGGMSNFAVSVVYHHGKIVYLCITGMSSSSSLQNLLWCCVAPECPQPVVPVRSSYQSSAGPVLWEYAQLLPGWMLYEVTRPGFCFFMVALCNRADHYIFILFLSSSFFFLLFFPRLISAVW